VFQFIVIGAAVGIYTESWYWFFGIFVGGAVLSGIPILSKLMALALAACWGAVGAAIADAVSEGDQTAIWATGVIVFLIAAGINFAATNHIKDLKRTDG